MLSYLFFFFFNDTATTEIYTLSLHDAIPIYADVYGLNAKFRGKPLWSVGAGWLIHNEKFMEDLKWINFLKLRASYGVTGNIYQGATSYMTATSGDLNSNTNLPMG